MTTRPINPDNTLGEQINEYRNRFGKLCRPSRRAVRVCVNIAVRLTVISAAWFYIFRIGRNNLRRPGVHPDIEMGQFNVSRPPLPHSRVVHLAIIDWPTTKSPMARPAALDFPVPHS